MIMSYRQLLLVLILVYHGNDAEWVKSQAMQLLLRLQVQALSKLWNLPPAFEVSHFTLSV